MREPAAAVVERVVATHPDHVGGVGRLAQACRTAVVCTDSPPAVSASVDSSLASSHSQGWAPNGTGNSKLASAVPQARMHGSELGNEIAIADALAADDFSAAREVTGTREGFAHCAVSLVRAVRSAPPECGCQARGPAP